eukprot:g78945.t1
MLQIAAVNEGLEHCLGDRYVILPGHYSRLGQRFLYVKTKMWVHRDCRPKEGETCDGGEEANGRRIASAKQTTTNRLNVYANGISSTDISLQYPCSSLCVTFQVALLYNTNDMIQVCNKTLGQHFNKTISQEGAWRSGAPRGIVPIYRVVKTRATKQAKTRKLIRLPSCTKDCAALCVPHICVDIKMPTPRIPEYRGSCAACKKAWEHVINSTRYAGTMRTIIPTNPRLAACLRTRSRFPMPRMLRFSPCKVLRAAIKSRNEKKRSESKPGDHDPKQPICTYDHEAKISSLKKYVSKLKEALKEAKTAIKQLELEKHETQFPFQSPEEPLSQESQDGCDKEVSTGKTLLPNACPRSLSLLWTLGLSVSQLQAGYEIAQSESCTLHSDGTSKRLVKYYTAPVACTRSDGSEALVLPGAVYTQPSGTAEDTANGIKAALERVAAERKAVRAFKCGSDRLKKLLVGTELGKLLTKPTCYMSDNAASAQARYSSKSKRLLPASMHFPRQNASPSHVLHIQCVLEARVWQLL